MKCDDVRKWPSADLILDVALEVHRGVKTGADDLADVATAADARPPPAVRCARAGRRPQLSAGNRRRSRGSILIGVWSSGLPVTASEPTAVRPRASPRASRADPGFLQVLG